MAARDIFGAVSEPERDFGEGDALLEVQAAECGTELLECAGDAGGCGKFSPCGIDPYGRGSAGVSGAVAAAGIALGPLDDVVAGGGVDGCGPILSEDFECGR